MKIIDPFKSGKPSEKAIASVGVVPGARIPAKNLYDVSQALSWVATHRTNADDRLDWQVKIPALLDSLAA